MCREGREGERVDLVEMVLDKFGLSPVPAVTDGIAVPVSL